MRAEIKNEGSFNSTSPIRFKISKGSTLPLPLCYTALPRQKSLVFHSSKQHGTVWPSLAVVCPDAQVARCLSATSPDNNSRPKRIYGCVCLVLAQIQVWPTPPTPNPARPDRYHKNNHSTDIIAFEFVSTMTHFIIIIICIIVWHRPFLPGTSLEPAVIPTAHASSFTLQYFPYYV